MSIGIYKIENKINQKVYIGQSFNIDKRWKRHISSSRKSTTKHLYAAMTSYGLDNFTFEILQSFDHNVDPDTLTLVERFWVKVYDSMDPNKGYNKREPGSTGTFSEETKKRISEAKKGKVPWNKGKQMSEDQKIKMRKPKTEEHKQKLRQPKSEEAKKNMRKSYKARMTKKGDK